LFWKFKKNEGPNFHIKEIVWLFFSMLKKNLFFKKILRTEKETFSLLTLTFISKLSFFKKECESVTNI
jgi:hypothetical protein